MDGSSREVLHNTTLADTYAITIDYENQVLYWADYTLNKIESSDVDGSNRRTLSTVVRDPYSIAYYNGSLYWGDDYYNRVLTGLATSPGSGTYLGGSLSYDVHGIQVVSRETQPLGQQHCNSRTLIGAIEIHRQRVNLPLLLGEIEIYMHGCGQLF